MITTPITAATVCLCALLGILCYFSLSQDFHLVTHLKKHAGVLSRPFLAPTPFKAIEGSGSLDLDGRALLPEFQAQCPLVYQRPTFEELRERRARPYLFGGQQRPACKQCHSVRDRGRVEFCAYIPKHGSPVCPHKDQEALLQYYMDRAENGSAYTRGLLQMTPCDLWPFIRGRTMWLMGDSITQEFMVAMECLFFEWHEHPRWLDGSGWGGLPFGRHRVSNNTEALEIITKEGQVPPWCIHLPERSRICHIRSNVGLDWADNVLPNIWRIGARNTDILVGNFAIWINNDTEYAVNLARVADYLRNATGQLPYIVWRDASVQHFSTHTGDYNGAPWPFHCQPIGNKTDAVQLHIDGFLSTDDPELQVIVEGGWRNKIAYPIIEDLNIPIMRTWNETVPLWSYHHHYNMKCGDQEQGCPDCTHTCHPSYYQVWVYHLYQTLMASQQQIRQHMRAAEGQLPFPQSSARPATNP